MYSRKLKITTPCYMAQYAKLPRLQINSKIFYYEQLPAFLCTVKINFANYLQCINNFYK